MSAQKITKAAEKSDETPNVTKSKGHKLRSVFGAMVHPYSNVRFDPYTVSDMNELDGWTQVQIDAGKLEIIGDAAD